MQLEGTETPTALTPNTSGDGGTAPPADNTTRSNVIVFEEVHVYGDLGSTIKTTSSLPSKETQNATPQMAVDSKQTTPENISPATQTQRSEATAPAIQETSGNSSSTSFSISQNTRGTSDAPQVQTFAP